MVHAVLFIMHKTNMSFVLVTLLRNHNANRQVGLAGNLSILASDFDKHLAPCFVYIQNSQVGMQPLPS